MKTAVICRLSAVVYWLPASGCQILASGFRLLSVSCPLTAGHSHSERSEESRCLLLVTLMLVNAREDVRLSDIRYQTSENGILKSKGEAPFGARVQAAAGASPQGG